MEINCNYYVFDGLNLKKGVCDMTTYYCVVSLNLMGVTDDLQVLYNNLYYRTKQGSCEITVIESLEEANLLAMQRNCFLSYWLGKDAMRLPVSGTYFLKRTVSVLEPFSTHLYEPIYNKPMRAMADAEMEIWGISFANGFAVVTNLNALMNYLEHRRYYVHAVWYPWNLEQANLYARREYIRRFYARYNAMEEQIILPPWELLNNAAFLDPKFEEREKRRSFSRSMQTLQMQGLM